MNTSEFKAASHMVVGGVDLSHFRKAGPLAVLTGGKGVFVYDEKGTPYLEAVSGMWCTSLGFGNEELIDAAYQQMKKLPYYHNLGYKSVSPAIELSERLAELVPIKNAKIYFALSGSEANDFLMKFIIYYNNGIGRPLKKKFISRINGYHGATLGSASLTGIPIYHAAFDLPMPNVFHVSDPCYYRGGLDGESPEEFATRLAKELEDLILREGPETVAAFIAEPVTGSGGVTVAPPTYYAKIQAVLKRHDVLFLADEVITGFLRTGKMWGCETMGIAPDTMTLAKGITSAYQPLAALVLSDDIYQGMVKACDRFGHFGHAGTASGNPVSCAVALKVLDIIKKDNLADHVERMSRHFEKRICALSDHPMVGEVRYKGLMGAIEFVADKRTKKRFGEIGMVSRMVKARAESTYKLIVRSMSDGDSCGLCPPLIISAHEMDEMFDRFEKALNDITDSLVRKQSYAIA